MSTKRTYYEIRSRGSDKFKRDLSEIGGTGQRAFKRIESSAKPARRSLLAINDVTREGRQALEGYAARLGPIGAGLRALGPGGLAAAAGVAAAGAAIFGAVRQARGAAQEFEDLANQSDKIGFAVESLQELRFAGEQVGVGINTTDMALQRFSRRVAEVAQGTGELKKTAEQYGIQLRDSRGQLRSNDDLLADFAETIRDAGSEQEQLRIAFKLFDSEGAAFVNVLKQGEAGIAAFRQEAREMGAVVDENIVRRGAEASNKLGTLSRVIQTNLNVAFVDLAPVLVSAAQGFAAVARAVRDVVDSFREAQNLGDDALGERIGTIQERVADRAETLRGLKANAATRSTNASKIRVLEERQAAEQQVLLSLTDEQTFRAIQDQQSRRGPGGGGPVAKTLDGLAGNKGRQAGGTRLGIRGAGGFFDQALSTSGASAATPPSEPGSPDSSDVRQIGTPAQERTLRAYEAVEAAAKRNAEAVQAARRAEEQRTEALEAQGETVRQSVLTPAESYRDRLDELRTLLDADTISQETFNRAVADARDELDAMNPALQDVQRIGERAFDRIGSAITEAFTRGEGAAVSFKSITQGVISEILQSFIELSAINPLKNALFGGDASTLADVGGLLGRLFSGGGGSLAYGTGSSPLIATSARGNVFDRPAYTSVSEYGHPEAVLPLRRLPSGDLGVQSGGGGGPVFNIDARGADQSGLEQLAAAVRAIGGRVRQMDRTFEARAVTAVANTRGRTI